MTPPGAHASRSTQAPISTISPVSSAIGMKSTGAIIPRVGMMPAQQRLERADAIDVEVEQRLKMELELSFVQCAKRRSLSIRRRSCARWFSCSSKKQKVPRPSSLARYSARSACLSSAPRIGAVDGRNGNADAGRLRNVVPVDLHAFGGGIASTLGEAFDGLAVVRLARDDDEFVAAKPRDETLREVGRRLASQLAAGLRRRPDALECR